MEGGREGGREGEIAGTQRQSNTGVIRPTHNTEQYMLIGDCSCIRLLLRSYKALCIEWRDEQEMEGSVKVRLGRD